MDALHQDRIAAMVTLLEQLGPSSIPPRVGDQWFATCAYARVVGAVAALGEILHLQQPAIAKIEKRADMYVSTLRRFIEAMGGALEITARFSDHGVVISNFHDLGVAGPDKSEILE